MLQSGYSMLYYILGAQLFLQPQIIHETEHILRHNFFCPCVYLTVNATVTILTMTNARGV